MPQAECLQKVSFDIFTQARPQAMNIYHSDTGKLVATEYLDPDTVNQKVAEGEFVHRADASESEKSPKKKPRVNDESEEEIGQKWGKQPKMHAIGWGSFTRRVASRKTNRLSDSDCH